MRTLLPSLPLFLLLVATLLVLGSVESFVGPQALPFLKVGTTTTNTSLKARKAGKRGNLGTLAQDGLVDKSMTPSKAPKRTKQKTNTSTKIKSGGGSSQQEQISPALAEWVAQNEDTTTTNSVETSDDGSSKKKKKAKQDSSSSGPDRRLKQAERKELEDQRAAQMDLAVGQLKTVLEESNNNLDEILVAVKNLLALPSTASLSATMATTLRGLMGGKARYNYRLAWVGSDDAICHIGTGLHKVPLARLQEVFFSCQGKNRIEIFEIIRLLGPFPNVRNTLQGTAQNIKVISDETDLASIAIVMDSMVDGTGREILAGTEDNIRRVDLQVYFADERAIVAVVPPSENDTTTIRSDPLENNGSNVLVFVREDELDDKLDALRVS